MESVKACGVCLGMDVRLYDMPSSYLKRYYESLTGTKVPSKSFLAYACYECAALLKKYYFFRQKSLRSQIVLDSIFRNYGKITEENVRQINRNSLLLNSSLSVQVINSAIDIRDVEPTLENSMKVEEGLTLESKLLSDMINDDVDFDWPSDEEIQRTKSENDILEISVNMEDGKESEGFTEETTELSVLETRKSKRKKSSQVKNLVAVKKQKKTRESILNTADYNIDEEEFKKYVTIVNLSVKEQFEEINKRKESKNYQFSLYKCELCFKGYIEKNAWLNHVQQHNVGVVECDICKTRYKSKHSLGLHLRRHRTKYHCRRCAYVSGSLHQAKRHILWHKGVTYTCPHCEKVFAQRTSYRTHVRVSHPSDVVCARCGRTFVSRLGLAHHANMAHRDLPENTEREENEEAPYCEACDVTFASTLAFKRHLVTARKHIEMSENKHGCRECGAAFGSAEALRAHTRGSPACRRHREARPQPRAPDTTLWPKQCPHCAKDIANAYLYWGHFRRCHPDKEYPIEKKCICEVCGKGFQKQRLLTWHMRSHTHANEFQCGECGRVLRSRRALQQHAAVHSDARPHVCALCGMAFKTKSALDRHTMVHTGEKPYECSYCGRCFSQSNTCHQHERTVHRKLPPLYVSRSKRERARKKQEAAL